MKNLFTAVILGIVLAGVSMAQGQSTGAAGKARTAVVEFTPGPNASGMTAEAKRQLQASIAFSLTESDRFDIVDVRRTRAATQDSLAVLNGDAATSAAVRVGKQLGVSYVLTGTVTEYNTKSGQVALKTRLIEVATGKVKYSGETTQKSTSPITSGGAAEMMSKSLKPCIEKLTAALTAVGL